MLTIEQALKLVADRCRPLAARRMEVIYAAGLVLAEDATSDVNSPPFDKALMDGYAVASGDAGSRRQVIETVAAGDVPHRAVTPGAAVRIMTGAPLPDGADAVVPLEDVRSEADEAIEILSDRIEPGQNVLPLGSSMWAGQVVVERDTRLRPIDVAILAEAGRGIVSVVPRPRVCVVPTGSELVTVSERPAPGQIRNSNGPLLVAAAAGAGGEAVNLGIARDDRAHLRELVEQGLKGDVLLLAGGVSAGDYDLVPTVLVECGVEMIFHKVSLRPGKPLWFGVHETDDHRTLVFGLPGNPVSSFVCFELFVRPTIQALAGCGFAGGRRCSAQIAAPYEHGGGRAAYLPARLDTTTTPPRVELLPWQGSADLAALGRANALVALPGEATSLAAGSQVEVLELDAG